MQMNSLWRLTILSGWIFLVLSLTGQDTGDPFLVELNAFTVYADTVQEDNRQAMQLSERMSREIRVDLQGRGGNRYQTDISIRGGIFEGTGLMGGGLALFVSQTGHYFS